MKNNTMDFLLLGLLIAYVLSPLDLAPGPIDDVIAVILYLAQHKFNNRMTNNDDDYVIDDGE